MNTKQIIALAAFAFAGTAAMADDITIVNEQFVAQKTRAEVQAEVLQARANGTLTQFGESEYRAPVVAAKSTLTREQVRAEFIASRSKNAQPAVNPGA